jgi:hypothetical protein
MEIVSSAEPKAEKSVRGTVHTHERIVRSRSQGYPFDTTPPVLARSISWVDADAAERSGDVMAMRKRVWIPAASLVVAVVGVAAWFGWQQVQSRSYSDQFPIAPGALSPTGRSAYYVLEPGYQLTYAGEDAQVVATVLGQTEQIDGVTARVLEERETKHGVLEEVSRNYLAMDNTTGDVYYLGEHVDEYSDGRVVGHGGSWRSGVANARFGLLLSGNPHVGQKQFEENAPGVALDRAEVVSTTETLQLPAGTFTAVVSVSETSPLEPVSTSRKDYAPGVGLVRDDELSLVKYGKTG